MASLIRRFVADRSAATAIEYALIAAGISMAIIAAVNNLGSTLSNSYASVSASLR
jgi:pilus assembly protein Flp/PilA